MAEYIENQMTVMGITDHAAKVTFNATLRPGYTREMLHDTIESYCAFIVAIREEVRQLEPRWAVKHWPDSETFLINLWDNSKGSHGMNFFTEHSTAQDALNFYWQCKDDLAAIDLARVLEVANEGEQAATLQPEPDIIRQKYYADDVPDSEEFKDYAPDTAYPVPTIVERKQAQQKKPIYRLGTEQADDEVLDQLLDVMGDYGEAFAREKQARQRHNPFQTTDSASTEELLHDLTGGYEEMLHWGDPDKD